MKRNTHRVPPANVSALYIHYFLIRFRSLSLPTQSTAVLRFKYLPLSAPDFPRCKFLFLTFRIYVVVSWLNWKMRKSERECSLLKLTITSTLIKLESSTSGVGAVSLTLKTERRHFNMSHNSWPSKTERARE